MIQLPVALLLACSVANLSSLAGNCGLLGLIFPGFSALKRAIVACCAAISVLRSTDRWPAALDFAIGVKFLEL
ncbi:MAG: hypothetical protein LH628_24225 [Microcoleus sp. CAN_BIN18]|nr:hypothetical protein [Microcoleus sp. CAN_BIN18]